MTAVTHARLTIVGAAVDPPKLLRQLELRQAA
ncbi:hypothetical protein GGQ65_005637 [Rhizobium fabae]|uniref:Uncharacterized protein n=1 Tax=Rhizobium fabae TaxID=573179 RepID=A0A7W6BFY3_9HYPH|nr:hypothetical protein [Rhizobium fabae]